MPLTCLIVGRCLALAWADTFWLWCSWRKSSLVSWHPWCSSIADHWHWMQSSRELNLSIVAMLENPVSNPVLHHLLVRHNSNIHVPTSTSATCMSKMHSCFCRASHTFVHFSSCLFFLGVRSWFVSKALVGNRGCSNPCALIPCKSYVRKHRHNQLSSTATNNTQV